MKHPILNPSRPLHFVLWIMIAFILCAIFLGVDYVDGISDYYYIYPDTPMATYDPDGNRLSRVADEGNDGKPDAVWQYRYDDAGNRLEENFDRDGDGTVDRREINSFECWK